MHRALGFEPVGRFPQVGHKLGRWHDVGWYRRVLVPHDSDMPCAAPPETLRIDEVLATAQACLPRD